jgi:hypothetical protein
LQSSQATDNWGKGHGFARHNAVILEDFDLDHIELTGTTISMEFGQGGRIQQLWVAESITPEGSQEFQFVCPPIDMGEEVTEDYFPGTILLGARTSPDDPWIVTRNATATRTGPDEGSPSSVSFVYEFPFLEDISAEGRFYEISGPMPQIAWDLTLANRTRRSIEIGELAFPLALNNVYEGFPRTDEGTRELFHDRIYVHKFIGGASSFVFGQRMNGRPPGLAIFPGEDTTWEFFNHAASSLTSPYRWEGVPIVYALSRAAIEREGWQEWTSGHTSLVLEPGDSRTYRMRFASTERFQPDPILSTLALAGRPVIGLYPAAVLPVEVPLTVEVAGATPTQFTTDVSTELETDSDDEGGSCTIRAERSGPVTLRFEDTSGRKSYTQLLFTESIAHLIKARAKWILQHQVVRDEGPMCHAIVAGNIVDIQPVLDQESFLVPFGIESGLSDALFLAEKNTRYPVAEEIKALENYLEHFLEQRVMNPGDCSIGALLPNPHAVAVDTGRVQNYAVTYCLYDSMARVADGYGTSFKTAQQYRDRREKIWRALVRNCALEEHNGIPLLSYITAESTDDLRASRRNDIGRRRYPFNSDSLWSTAGFEEAFWTARARADSVGVERYLRYAFAARSVSPCWWWYGSDKRWTEAPHSPGHVAMEDKGEMCFGPTTTANSLLYLSTLDRDSERISQSRLRMAFGGLMGIWSLIRHDGAASFGFCPDSASKQAGMSWTTGDVGIGLYHYLRGAASIVLATRTEGLQTFGCHFESMEEGADERFVLRPWDGLGKRILVRHLGLEAVAQNCVIHELAFDAAKRNARLELENPSDKPTNGIVEVRGMWGEHFDVDANQYESVDGMLTINCVIKPKSKKSVQIRVVS